jgi:hypothetical protein
MEYWGTFCMSISVSALRVVTIYRLPLGRLKALKLLVLYLYGSSLLHYSKICELHNPQVYRLRSSVHYLVLVGEGSSEDRFTWLVVS